MELLIYRMNVLDSIEHFCVDMLDMPEYIPQPARVVFYCVERVIEQDLIRRMLDYNPTTRITAMDIIVGGQYDQYDYQKHPYFKGIDFSQLQYQKPPYVPPFTPLPIIYDDVLILDSCYYNEQELENELNILRGSFDATYKEELEIQKEGK